MKILYDYQIFTSQNYGGISRYFYELIKCTDESSPESLKLGLKFSNNSYLNHNFGKGIMPFFPNTNFPRKQWLYQLFNEGYSKHMISNSDYDILHPTYYSTYFLDRIKKKNRPYVITCYDMIHEIFCEKYPEFRLAGQLMENKKELITGASKVIAISEQTKQDIMKIYNVDGSNIEVIYLGNSLVDGSQEDDAIVKDPYLLFVGNRLIYKNFTGLIYGIYKLLISNNLKLVCAGGGGFNSEEEALIKRLGIEKHVLNISFKHDNELSNLYHNAISFIFPSLYEGFGIPVLEAFACKCPIIMSAGGSLAEVGGEAAMYFEPENTESIYNTVSNVIGDSGLRNQLVRKGSERLKIFSWNDTYQQTTKLYEKII